MTNSSSYRIFHMHLSTEPAPGNADNFNEQAALQGRGWPLYFFHVPMWLLLYFLPQLILLIINVQPYFYFANPFSTIHLLSFMLVVIYSYLNYNWVAPWFITAKKIPVYFVLATIIIGVITGLQYMAENALTVAVGIHSPVLFMPFYNFILLIVSMFTVFILRLQQNTIAGKKEMAKMNLSLLNTQINPHFLFNSLNWIYLLAIEKSAETSKAIIQLSGLMRYILQEAASESIDLTKELDYIRNYLALQKGRLGNTVILNTSVPVYCGKAKIAPLLAMSFIENAFKHGINPHEDSAINIDISITENRFCLQVINNKVSPQGHINSCGMGIQNARQRLQALYPAMHQLEILEDSKIYSLKLSIRIL